MLQLTITECLTMDQWRGLRADWNQLLHESDASSFFLSWEWLYSWAQVCLDKKNALFIIALHYKDKLVGLAPFYIARKKMGPFIVREAVFISTPGSGADYLDVICAKGFEKRVAESLFDYLCNTVPGKWDQLTFSSIRADSLFLIHFETVIEQHGKSSDFKRSSYCPVMELPESEKCLYAAMSPSWRKKFKQDRRVAQRDYQLEHRQLKGKDVTEGLGSFFRLYKDKGGHSEQPLMAIHQSLIDHSTDQPPLQLDFLIVDGVDVAALLHFEYRDTLFMYLMAVDKGYNRKISFGNILIGMVLINAIESRCRFYDFLKGTERYKFHWANTGYSTVSFRFRQKRFSTICLSIMESHKRLAKLILR